MLLIDSTICKAFASDISLMRSNLYLIQNLKSMFGLNVKIRKGHFNKLTLSIPVVYYCNSQDFNFAGSVAFYKCLVFRAIFVSIEGPSLDKEPTRSELLPFAFYHANWNLKLSSPIHQRRRGEARREFSLACYLISS